MGDLGQVVNTGRAKIGGQRQLDTRLVAFSFLRAS